MHCAQMRMLHRVVQLGESRAAVTRGVAILRDRRAELLKPALLMILQFQELP